MKQSIVLQMSYCGAPMIYYGDEAGMWSPDDPSNRQPMVWKDLEPYDDPQVKFNADVFNHYMLLIAIRQKLPALQVGFPHTVLADDAHGVIAIGREFGGQSACVVINRSADQREIDVPFAPADRDVSVVNWLDGQTAFAVSTGGIDLTDRPSVYHESATLTARHGHCRLTLPAWGSAILSVQ
jgi:glycosidase